MVRNAQFVESKPRMDTEGLLRIGARMLSERSGVSRDLILGALLERSRLGETPAEAGVALPHLLLNEVTEFHLIVVRSIPGIDFPMSDQAIHAVFLLLGDRKNPAQHLRFLAEIARRAENPRFIDEWVAAESVDELRQMLLDDEGD
jgi:mannitol/fructose-specific phosphotransferase system IIA component (Ntr-type)